MKSHTVPRKLLEQFAYHHVSTNSARLWRYGKGEPPFGKASPKSAARTSGHFANPSELGAETAIEARLATEVENPVNALLDRLIEPTFFQNDQHRAQLTRYVTLLFSRSLARRAGTKHLQDVTVYALSKFMENEAQLLNVATKWNLDVLLSGATDLALLRPQDVRNRVRGMMESYKTAEAEQQRFSESVVRMMSTRDEAMYRGEWKLLTTTQDKPYILSDSPVVTWQRDDALTPHHGGGFWRPNVEILLPVSPLKCLHILPAVERTRPVVVPTADEVNTAEAAFAYQHCFANVFSRDIDALVQDHISTAKMGDNVFTVWHRQYDNAVYEELMSGRVRLRR